MTLPNFLIVGAAKSGTTAIQSYINQHPDIFMSDPKELRFFSYTGPAPQDLPAIYTHHGVTTLQEYQLHFKDADTKKIIGEASPMYLYEPGTAERIRQTIPDVKMLMILRNPVDRAYSAYLHAVRDWIEPAKTFTEALAMEQERIDAGWGMLWHYTHAGFYYEQLMRYYQNFDSNQIKVVLYDDLIDDMDALLTDIFEFLDIDPTFKPDTSSHPNVSGYPINHNYHKLIYELFFVNNLKNKINNKKYPKMSQNKTMDSLRSINLGKKTMPDEIRQSLNAVFSQDIKKLESLIHRDLSSWKK